MAPLKQPILLFKLCLKAVALLISRTCNSLYKKHGTHSLLHKQDINEIQNHVLFFIPGHVLDEVCKEWINKVYTEGDPTVGIAVYMHRHIKTFDFGQKYIALSTHCDSLFWKFQLSQTNAIVFLNLACICTDEILEVVGKNCHNVEYIDISSPAVISSPVLDFLNTRWQYVVTDNGLLHLEKCKRLKTVLVNFKDMGCVLGQEVSVTAVRRLLKSLPLVEEICYYNMGTVIADDMFDIQSLLLTQVTDCSPKVAHILAMSRLCINLQHLVLNFEDFLNSCNKDVINTLKMSNLNLTALCVGNLHCADEFFDFLIVKGSFLTSLELEVDFINKHLVYEIGKCCPNIRNFILTCIVPGEIDMKPNCIYGANEKIFTELESLNLKTFKYNVEDILAMILIPAKRIMKLEIQLYNTKSDNVFNKILPMNPLTELTEVFAGCVINEETVTHFFRNPNMRKLSLSTHTITDEKFSALSNEIKESNLDIILEYV